MTTTVSRLRAILVATSAVVLLLAGCGTLTGTDDGVGVGGDPRDYGAGDVPITQRAIAAVALEHLPGRTSHRQASYTDERDVPGTLGADLRYAAGEADDGDLVRVRVQPGQDPPRCQEMCVRREVPGGVLYLTWGLVEPEEDPGGVAEVMVRDDETVVVSYAGPDITGDPRRLDLPIGVEALEAVARDARISLTTTQDVVDAGEDVDNWSGQEPDPDTYRTVASDAASLAAFWREQVDSAGEGRPTIVSVEDSPVVAELGGADLGRVVSSRVTLRPTKRSPYRTLDLVVSEERPARFAGDPCDAEGLEHCWRGVVGGPGPIWVVWNDGPEGEVWVVHDGPPGVHFTDRFAGWDVADTWHRLIDQVNWLPLTFTFDDDATGYGFTTLGRYADEEVP